MITQVGHKILSSAAQPHLQKTAVEAAGQFASYRSSLLPLPVTYLTTLTATPTEPKGPPISVGVGCAKPRSGAEARSGAIFGFGGFSVGNCADLVIWPTKPEVLHLDNVDSKNVTFSNYALVQTATGGRLPEMRGTDGFTCEAERVETLNGTCRSQRESLLSCELDRRREALPGSFRVILHKGHFWELLSRTCTQKPVGLS